MFVLVLIVLILFPDAAQEGAREGLKFAFERVLPSILPFSVASCALVYSGLAEKIGRFFMPLAKLMHINPYGITALFTGFLGGYPTGCKVVCDMHREGLIGKDECEKMLTYANNGGLIFALNICGSQAFGTRSAGWGMFFVSVISVFITALILGRSEGGKFDFSKKEKLPFMAVMGKSIASGGSVIINIASSFVVFYAISYALRLSSIPHLEGLVEMTRGIMYAGRANNLPLAAFFFTLGGVGVFAQSAAICSEYSIGMKGYVKGKLLSSSLAFVIAYFFTERPFFNKEIILFSLLAVVAVVFAVKTIKKLYASA